MAGSRHKYRALLRLAVAAGELLLAGLAGWAAAQGPGLGSRDDRRRFRRRHDTGAAGGVRQRDANASSPGAAAAKGITTVEGLWTFGTPPDAAGDYPLLLNGSNANGGFAVPAAGHQRQPLRQDQSREILGALAGRYKLGRRAAPVEGTAATAVSLAVVLPQIPDNSPAGTLVATAAVTMTPAGATFTGPLVSSNPLFTAQGVQHRLVARRHAGRRRDGPANVTITALQ